MVYGGREPGRMMTRHGGLLFIVTPLVLLFFVIMFLAFGSRLPLPVILALTAGAALLASGLNYLLWPQPAGGGSPGGQCLAHLVPVLQEAGWPRDGLQFLSGLCVVSRQAGHADAARFGTLRIAPSLDSVR